MKLSTEVAVIGGGATGLGIAWDACLRGFKVLVFEKGDLAEGTSGRYHGLLHSGARYAVSDPASATDCARENTLLRRVALDCIEDTGGLFLLVQGDPPEYADLWLSRCKAASVPVVEIDPARALHAEPALPRNLERVFRVQDASLDSFQLLHELFRGILQSGGRVHPRSSFLRFLMDRKRVVGLEVRDDRTGESHQVLADIVINAAGPWAGRIAGRAGIRLPLALSRGTMIALAARPVQTVLNRCAYPGDGDIVVPIGTVVVLGTTDEPTSTPENLTLEHSEIETLIRLGGALLPDLPRHRMLRAWVGIRPLYRPPGAAESETRALPRAHTVLDHETLHGIPGLISVLGGKLTTYRLMAEETVDLVARHLGERAKCQTAEAPLPRQSPRFHALPDRLQAIGRSAPSEPGASVVCECELVTQADIQIALDEAPTFHLDDLRRELRLGMGPCQAAFCGYRAAGIVSSRISGAPLDGGLREFLDERWRGTHLLGWGTMLRQLELQRRISLELLGVTRARP